MNSTSPKKMIWLGVSITFCIFLAAILAPWLSPQDPLSMQLSQRLAPPSMSHLFGLDQNGSDILSKMLYGARVSLLVAITVVTIGLSVGLILGTLAGYFGGWIDVLLMRLIDLFYAFPGFLLALTFVAVLGPSIPNLIIAMSATAWTSYARLVRAEVLHLRTKDYVLSTQALGASHPRVILFHIWPNLTGPLVVQCTFGMAGAILAESGLSFLGLGAPPETPTWGSLLNSGRAVLIEAPHVSIFPGFAILVLVLGFNLFGDGLRDLLDPKKKS